MSRNQPAGTPLHRGDDSNLWRAGWCKSGEPRHARAAPRQNRTSLASNADETFDETSGVARATIAARRTSSVERPAGNGWTRT